MGSHESIERNFTSLAGASHIPPVPFASRRELMGGSGQGKKKRSEMDIFVEWLLRECFQDGG